MMASGSTSLPAPLRWQTKALRHDREVLPRLTVAAVGRRSGKSHYGLLWLMLAPGGLRDGQPTVWGAPTDPQLSEIREVFRRWFPRFRPKVQTTSPEQKAA